MAGVTVRMLRHYDEIGLLRPALIDTRTNYRYYSDVELLQLHRITLFKSLGFSLQTVAPMIRDQTPRELRAFFEVRIEEITNDLTTSHRQLEKLRTLLFTIEKDHIMSPSNAPHITVDRKYIPAMRVVELSGVAPDFGPESIGPVLQPLFATLMERVHMNDLVPTGPPIAYYVDAFDDNGIEVHAAIPVGPIEQPVADLRIVTLPAIDASSTIHRGAMNTIGETYRALIAWIADNAMATVGYSREVYLEAPEDMSQWVTELQFAVAPR